MIEKGEYVRKSLLFQEVKIISSVQNEDRR